MKGWGSRNRGVPPAKGSVGKFAGGKAASKVPAAGKAAAKVPAGKGAAGKAASAGATHERLRVKCGRVIGKVVRCRGQEGWIRDSVHMVVTWGLWKDGAKSSAFIFFRLQIALAAPKALAGRRCQPKSAQQQANRKPRPPKVGAQYESRLEPPNLYGGIVRSLVFG